MVLSTAKEVLFHLTVGPITTPTRPVKPGGPAKPGEHAKPGEYMLNRVIPRCCGRPGSCDAMLTNHLIALLFQCSGQRGSAYRYYQL